MKIVASSLDSVPVSSVRSGSTVQWAGSYYIRTCRSLCERGIWGVNLEDGCYISDGAELVKPVDAEVRVL